MIVNQIVSVSVRKAFILALLALLAGPPLLGGVFPYEVQRTTLDNGLKVLFIPMPSDGLVAYWSVVRTGSRDEVEEGVTGFAHFFEHMMFRGSEKYPGPVYDGIVKPWRGRQRLTSEDLTAYHLSITQDDLPQVIEIESDRFQNLKYGEPEFKTKPAPSTASFAGRPSPYFVWNEALASAAFDQRTYKHTTIDSKRTSSECPSNSVFRHSSNAFTALKML
jgi:zinc protease